MDLVKKQLTPEVTLSVTENSGVLTIRLERVSPSGNEAVEINENLKYFIDKEKGNLPAWAQAVVTAGEALVP